jgi:hypothetical protein
MIASPELPQNWGCSINMNPGLILEEISLVCGIKGKETK